MNIINTFFHAQLFMNDSFFSIPFLQRVLFSCFLAPLDRTIDEGRATVVSLYRAEFLRILNSNFSIS